MRALKPLSEQCLCSGLSLERNITLVFFFRGEVRRQIQQQIASYGYFSGVYILPLTPGHMPGPRGVNCLLWIFFRGAYFAINTWINARGVNCLLWIFFRGVYFAINTWTYARGVNCLFWISLSEKT